MVAPTGSSSHGGGGDLEEARSSGTGRMRPNVCSSPSSFNGQRDGEPSCSSPDCVQPVLVSIMPNTCGIADRYPVSCLVSGLIPVGIRLGTWVSWLGVRPGTRRYQTCYLVPGYHG
uniref:Uncharacterized protein n=1 Tax=Oryza glumipatula TaxID=40148 RepID=A0A0D9ZKC6_9ORYZ